MPYTPQPQSTPESLLPRTDSKNPSTTCAGITSSGRPCRRPLASPTSSSRARRASAPPNPNDATNGYCWQHRDQASLPSPRPPPAAQLADAHAAKPQRRTSTDTLVAKFEAADLASTVVDVRPSRPRPQQRPQKKKKQPSLWESLCCISGGREDPDDYVEVVRHKRRTSQHPSSHALQPAARPPMTQANAFATPQRPQMQRPQTQRPQMHHVPASAPAATVTPTQNFMRYISPTLSPSATAALLTELSKPLSAADQEGYIYIFWLTPDSETNRAFKPTDDDAERLLQPSKPRPKPCRWESVRGEELLRANSVVRRPGSGTRGAPADGGEQKRTILLKIGRANNVHRRMAEWTRQCGYDLSLVRFYPYVPSSKLPSSPLPSPSGRPSLSPRPSDGIRKVPYVHRVERLIQLELEGQRKKQGKCEACGREHREWFEVEASRDGVRAVDAVVKKWVDWAEGVAGS